MPNPVSRTVQRFGSYSAAVQAALRSALCGHEETRPGTYRSLIRLWIGASGAVARAELLTTSGDAARDAVLFAALRAIAVGEPPPPDLPQPITLLLVPSGALAARYCPDGASALGRAKAGEAGQ
jgi:hypothetical protein